MARFYGWGHTEIMKMPIRAFWMYSRMVEKIRANELKQSLRVAVVCQSSEAVTEYSEELQERIGEVMSPDIVAETLDVDGLNDLRNLQ